MDFNRQNQRRRKLAIDQKQSEQALETESSSKSSDGKVSPRAKQYNEGARRSRQLKTTDLIPKRPLSIAAVIFVLALMVGLFNLLHYNSASWQAALDAPSLQVLQMNSDNSLVSWYANLLLLLTCGASLQVYLLRQHRRDDYRGTYRIWLWLAALFLIASMTSTSGLYSLTKLGLERLVADRLSLSIVSLMLILKLAGLTLLTARAVYEVRYSKAAVVALTVVFVALGTAAMMENPKIHTLVSDNLQAAHGNLVLIGVSALFASVLLFARLVYFQAHGMVATEMDDVAVKAKNKRVAKKADSSSSKKTASRTRKKKVADDSEEENDSTTKTKSARKSADSEEDSKPNSQSKTKRRKATRKKVKPVEPVDYEDAAYEDTAYDDTAYDDTAYDDAEYEDHDELEGLSKSERRRQRKQQRRMKRAA